MHVRSRPFSVMAVVQTLLIELTSWSSIAYYILVIMIVFQEMFQDWRCSAVIKGGDRRSWDCLAVMGMCMGP